MGLFSKLRKIFSPAQKEVLTPVQKEVLTPESRWIVAIDDTLVRTIDFQKTENSILISEINEVVIFTNDTGPVGIDVWWRLSGNEKMVFVPGGATGEREMLDMLQKLSEFNNEALIKAMGSTDNAEFLLWKR